MRAVDIIIKKRDKLSLTEDEIQFFIRGYTEGSVPDYQASALAMAILLNGMTSEETKHLTISMAESGDILDLSKVVPIAVDKHSTGGVGDKTTLVVAPAVAACGLPVGKMSGRGLGFSGGTLDKMESIPGYRVDLSTQEFIDQLKSIGIVLTGQSVDLAPADGKLYALRDVTGTVQSIPLIASSIMSKKIAAGAQAIVLDVKYGYGAFMKTLEEAKALGSMMVDIAKLAHRNAVAILSDMNQPLGFTIGNALELREAIDVLKGQGPEDFREHCLRIASYMLILGGISSTQRDAQERLIKVLDDGSALKKFIQLVEAQGGDAKYVLHPDHLPKATIIETIKSTENGFLSEINAKNIGEASVVLGAGREKKGAPIDHAVGIVIRHKVGDYVEEGEPLFEIHANNKALIPQAKEMILRAYQFANEPVEPLPQFSGVVQ